MMKLCLMVGICLCAALSELTSASSNVQDWLKYKGQYGKVYEGEEDARRFANYLANKKLVERHNANSNASYKMRLNHMSDWSDEEFQQLNGFSRQIMTGDRTRSTLSGARRLPARLSKLLEGPVPDEVDWRNVPNRVAEVKAQMMCGSCWAFSTTGLLEGQQVVRNFSSKLIPLSEQQLIDCSRQNSGCYGGIMQRALQDIHKLGGIESEQDYSYDAEERTCRMNKSEFVMTVKGAHFLKQGDEEELKKAVAIYGPIAIAICATRHLQLYSYGVFSDDGCDKWALNHAVLVVGYGSDPKEGDYWIIKNCWSAKWGEDGYVRMKRGVNMCGVAEVPTLADF